jgi:hypothetical protein
MGIPAPAGTGASGTPAPGDQANAVVSGIFTALGTTRPFSFYGPFNVVLYASITSALTTTKGSNTASVASGTGIAAGQSIKSANVPPGTTWASFSGTSGTLAFPPGQTSAAVVTGTDAGASYTGSTINYTGSVQLERSFDGGYTWVVCGVGGSGTQAVFVGGGAISVLAAEPERGVLYRLNCTALSANNINYRLSATGVAALSLAVAAAI